MTHCNTPTLPHSARAYRYYADSLFARKHRGARTQPQLTAAGERHAVLPSCLVRYFNMWAKDRTVLPPRECTRRHTGTAWLQRMGYNLQDAKRGTACTGYDHSPSDHSGRPQTRKAARRSLSCRAWCFHAAPCGEHTPHAQRRPHVHQYQLTSRYSMQASRRRTGAPPAPPSACPWAAACWCRCRRTAAGTGSGTLGWGGEQGRPGEACLEEEPAHGRAAPRNSPALWIALPVSTRPLVHPSQGHVMFLSSAVLVPSLETPPQPPLLLTCPLRHMCCRRPKASASHRRSCTPPFPSPAHHTSWLRCRAMARHVAARRAGPQPGPGPGPSHVKGRSPGRSSSAAAAASRNPLYLRNRGVVTWKGAMAWAAHKDVHVPVGRAKAGLQGTKALN